ncbi:hypothetical protein JY651_47440 [Pyxidicoccus parkwayensis]|uniref:Methyltransferase domain-containing protein n=1 Tax=Pyxidicoccus parkwayensis TaxID=2813578 RepID=A0ABX7NWC3_9BACT|nr:hypothetical protein [Pyxidicoccus parkwaysis]QSQ22659.1 hypothetical protein JY651_47440 [Pyxidicoccus parkwaysis]
MEQVHRESAGRMRSLLCNGQSSPAIFRTALTSVPPGERDEWLDLVLGLDTVPDDGPALPRGCVPYMPCPVDAVLRMVEHAQVQPGDVFVDIGSGVGRVAALTHLLSGAAVIGLEIQPDLVRASREMAKRLSLSRLAVVEGDAARLAGDITTGSVFFMYCPFSGERLEQVLDGLESIARTRQLRICCVDLPLPARPWLTLVSPPSGDLDVYRSSEVSH